MEATHYSSCLTGESSSSPNKSSRLNSSSTAVASFSSQGWSNRTASNGGPSSRKHPAGKTVRRREAEEEGGRGVISRKPNHHSSGVHSTRTVNYNLDGLRKHLENIGPCALLKKQRHPMRGIFRSQQQRRILSLLGVIRYPPG